MNNKRQAIFAALSSSHLRCGGHFDRKRKAGRRNENNGGHLLYIDRVVVKDTRSKLNCQA